jgi:hypothetical protein
LPGKIGELTADLFEVASVFDSIETVGSELQVCTGGGDDGFEFRSHCIIRLSPSMLLNNLNW